MLDGNGEAVIVKRSHHIRRPEEFKALADARRIKVLAWLTQEALTVTQLAERLGELPATMHHHVKLLERAGLVAIAHTREKSGILEKYYRAVAERIVADHGVGRLSEPAAIAVDAAGGALRAGIDRLDAGRAEAAFTFIEEFLMTEERVAELVLRLQKVLERDATGKSDGGEPWLAVIAIFPTTREGR
jgi:DNA-binding transcriptional ArsR family regulator